MLAETKLDTMSAIYQRRAVRSCTAEKIEKDTMEQLLDAAVHAPTAVHREPWAFVIIQNKERLRQYSDRAKSLLLAQEEATSFFRAAEPKALAMLSDPNFNIFYDAGTLVVIGCKARGPFVEADCWLAAENLMLAATAKGLGTCCIGFAVNILNTPEVKRELGIPEGGAAVAPIIIGVPTGRSPRAREKLQRSYRGSRDDHDRPLAPPWVKARHPPPAAGHLRARPAQARNVGVDDTCIHGASP